MLNIGYNYRDFSVLYVDDEPQALKYFVRGFSDDFRVETAASAAEAWQMIEDDGGRYGVLITDQRMPGTSGTDLLQQVRHGHPRIVRILVTGYSDLEAAIQAVNLGGAFRYITKPWDSREFRGVLLRAMEFHIMQRDRDRLLREKLHVLQRISLMDRARGLSVFAASYQARLRNPWAALKSYLRQALISRGNDGWPTDAGDFGQDLRDWNRVEAERMLRTVQYLVDELKDLAAPEHPELLAELAGRAVDASQTTCTPARLRLTVNDGTTSIRVVPPLFQRMLSNLLHAVARLESASPTVTMTVTGAVGDTATVDVSSEGEPWTLPQLAPFFSSVVPAVSSPAPSNLDLLSSFFVAHHYHGTIEIRPDTRALAVTIATNAPVPEEPADAAWFDTVFAQSEEWMP